MAIIERLIASCHLGGLSEVFLRYDDVTERLLEVIVRGKSDRLIEIAIREPLRPLTHDRTLAKSVDGITYDLRAADIPFIPDGTAPIVPGIRVSWHDPRKR